MHTNHKRVGYSVNPLVAAVTGAVVGAGMAVVGAVAMSDKKNQDKVKTVVKDVEDRSKKIGDIAKNAVKDVKNL